MQLISPSSLSETLDAVGDAHFWGRTIGATDRKGVAAWVAQRQGLPGAYASTFALFPDEARAGIRLFTGERATNASARHIAGQEACRALRLLNAKSASACEALATASQALANCVGPAAPTDPKPDDGKKHGWWAYRGGTYCCGACSVGFWRHLLSGGYDQHETRLERGLRCLRSCRKGDGKWRAYPFWYTLLALVEMPCDAAVAEIRYTAKWCELAASRKSENPYAQRRSELARRALARI